MPTISSFVDKAVKQAQAFDTLKDAWAIVPAAGTSQRMRDSLAEDYKLNDLSSNFQSKIFLELKEGLSVFHYSLRSLYLSGLRSICVSTQKELFELIDKIAKEVTSEGEVWDNFLIVEGGETRFQSVRNAMFEIQNFSPKVVAIHDAARPFPPVNDIYEVLDFVLEEGIKSDIGAILASPVSSTIKLSNDNDFISYTPERDKLWEAQTPQIFPYNALLEAYKTFPIDSNFSDDASIFEKIGKKVKVFKSSPDNIKITTKKDYYLARLLVESSL